MVDNSVVIFAPSLALDINCCVFVFSSFGYLCFILCLLLGFCFCE